MISSALWKEIYEVLLHISSRKMIALSPPWPLSFCILLLALLFDSLSTSTFQDNASRLKQTTFVQPGYYVTSSPNINSSSNMASLPVVDV